MAAKVTKIEWVIVALVLIAIIVSSGTLYHGFSVMDKVTTLTDSVVELTSTVGGLATTVGGLAEAVGAYSEEIAATQARIAAVEEALKPPPMKTFFTTLSGWDKPPMYHGNPFVPGGVGGAHDYIFGFLMGYNPISGTYWPWLATSYEEIPEEAPEKLIVHLRRDIKWQDGTPFTSRDVRTSFYISGAVWAWGHIWRFIKNIETPDDYTVVFNYEPERNILLRTMILKEWIKASHAEYGEYLPAAEEIMALRKQEWAISKEISKLEEKALKEGLTEEEEALMNKLKEEKEALKEQLREKADALKERLAEYKPPYPFGYGPFMVKYVTTEEMKLVKNPYFWAAENIVDEFIMWRFTTNEIAWAEFIAGRVDMEKPATPPTVVEAILAAQPAIHHVPAPDFTTFCLLMNQRKYPFNETRFRHGLAYLLDRDTIRKISLFYGTTVEYPCGMLPSQLDAWISPGVKAQLNKYEHSVTKAEELFKAVGLQKIGDKWCDPDGNPLYFEIIAPAAYTDWVLAADEIARQLTAFGIEAKCFAVEWPRWDRYKAELDYDMAIEFGVFSKEHPYKGYERLLGWLSHITGHNASKEMLELVEKLQMEFDVAKQKEMLEKLALYINEEVMVIEFLEKQAQFFIADGIRVTGWPFDTPEMIELLGFNWRMASVKWMAEGVLKGIPRVKPVD